MLGILHRWFLEEVDVVVGGGVVEEHAVVASEWVGVDDFESWYRDCEC